MAHTLSFSCLLFQSYSRWLGRSFVTHCLQVASYLFTLALILVFRLPGLCSTPPAQKRSAAKHQSAARSHLGLLAFLASRGRAAYRRLLRRLERATSLLDSLHKQADPAPSHRASIGCDAITPSMEMVSTANGSMSLNFVGAVDAASVFSIKSDAAPASGCSYL